MKCYRNDFSKIESETAEVPPSGELHETFASSAIFCPFARFIMREHDVFHKNGTEKSTEPRPEFLFVNYDKNDDENDENILNHRRRD